MNFGKAEVVFHSHSTHTLTLTQGCLKKINRKKIFGAIIYYSWRVNMSMCGHNVLITEYFYRMTFD